MTKTTVYLQKSTRSGKKYMVTIITPTSKKTVHFGAEGYSDDTKHKDKERMKKYDARHKPRENWGKSGINTAGFWSKWLLWSKPSLSAAKTYTANKFNITIKSRPPPTTKKSPKRKSPKRKSPKRKSKSRKR